MVSRKTRQRTQPENVRYKIVQKGERRKSFEKLIKQKLIVQMKLLVMKRMMNGRETIDDRKGASKY